MHAEIGIDSLIIIFQCLSILLIVWLTSKFGIHPILKSVDKIRNDEQMPIIGANEFRYLARMYNKMYSVYKSSIAKLNYKASHDELTGLYNRAGYDLLLSGIDLQSTFLLLIDVDDFKTINDTFGHDIGDSVLIRVAKTLSDHFRSDDYVCRIGGDEFAVFMVHADSTQQKLIEDKLRQINFELAKKDENQSCTSISVGIAHGSQAADPQMLFKHVDEALYETKRGGKKGYTFYQVQYQQRTG
ncbi:MAG: GGDEF domain-containing protein [Butyrivibrio sp.]|nr:GGDEF domain-containing protein [Butyrivibrio sp.]